MFFRLPFLAKLNKLKLKRLLFLPEFLARRSFVVFLVLFSLSVIASVFVFYQYYYAVIGLNPQPASPGLYLDEKAIDQALAVLKEREARFQGAETRYYTNPFGAETVDQSQ